MNTKLTIFRVAMLLVVISVLAQTAPCSGRTLYGITGSGKLIRINTNNGVGMLIKNTGLSNAESLEIRSDGKFIAIANDPNMASFKPNHLFEMALDGTNVTDLGAVQTPNDPSDPNPNIVEAMTFGNDGTTLYGAAGYIGTVSSEELIQIDAFAPGSSTKIGPFDPDPNNPNNIRDINGMAMMPISGGILAGTLFGYDIDGFGSVGANSLVTINKLTGASTGTIGNPTTFANQVFGLEFDDNNGILYGALHTSNSGGPATLVTINTSNATITPIGTGIGFSSVHGLVFAVPEPSTWLISAMGLVGVLGYSRRVERLSPLSPSRLLSL